MKIFKIPLILFTLLLFLGGVAYWDELLSRKEKENESRSKLLINRNKDALVGITITKGTQKIRLELDNKNRWRIKNPVDEMANDERVRDIIDGLFTYKYEKAISDPNVEMKSFGLKNPNMQVELLYSDQERLNLSIGDNVPVGYSVYLQMAGDDRVLLGPQHIRNIVSVSLADVRFKSLNIGQSENITEIDFVNKNAQSFVFKKENQSWSLASQEGVKLSQAELGSFLGDLRRAKIKNYIDDPSDSLDAAIKEGVTGTTVLGSVKITSAFEEDERSDFTVKFFLNNDQLYARYKDYLQPEKLLLFENDLISLFDRDLFSFTDKKIFAFDRQDVSGLQIDDLSFNRGNEKWYTLGKGVDSQFSNDLDSLLIDLEYLQAVASPTQIESEREQLEIIHQITLKFRSPHIINVTIARNKQEEIFVRQEGEKKWFPIDSNVLEGFSFLKGSRLDEFEEESNDM